MGAVINFTPSQPLVVTVPVSGSASFILQPLLTAIDIGSYDLLDLELAASGNALTSAATIGLATGMQIDTDDSYINATTIGTGNVANLNFGATIGNSTTLIYQAQSFGPTVPIYPAAMSTQGPAPLLRYARWVIKTAAQSTSPGTIVFWLRGIARRVGP